jgi:hypothetical protein
VLPQLLALHMQQYTPAGACYDVRASLTAAGQSQLRHWVAPSCQQRVGSQGGSARIIMLTP